MIRISKATRAVTRFASRDECRLNLTGVLFEADGRQIATDGHILGVLTPEAARYPLADFPVVCGTPTDRAEPILIPAAVVEDAVKALPRRPVVAAYGIAHEVQNGGKPTLALTDKRTTRTVDPLNVDFPDYTQVLPANEKFPLSVGFNPAYLGQIAAAAADIGATSVRCEFQAAPPARLPAKGKGKHGHADADHAAAAANGLDAVAPARFTMRGKDGDQLVVILMPMRL